MSEIEHYDRLGMKWYQHIFGKEQAQAKYNQNKRTERGRRKEAKKFLEEALKSFREQYEDTIVKNLDAHYDDGPSRRSGFQNACIDLGRELISLDQLGRLTVDDLNAALSRKGRYEANRASEWTKKVNNLINSEYGSMDALAEKVKDLIPIIDKADEEIKKNLKKD